MMILEFLAVGAWGFWLLLAISAIAMSEMVDNDSPGWATITLIGTFGLLWLLGGFNPFALLLTNPGEVAMYLLGYFVAGTLWCLAKWYFWLSKARRRFDEIRKEYPHYSAGEISSMMRRERLPYEFPPRASDHKARIMGWMTLWPASMVWTMINDPVRRVFEEIYASIGGLTQRISDHVWKDAEMPVPKSRQDEDHRFRP